MKCNAGIKEIHEMHYRPRNSGEMQKKSAL